MDNPHFWFFGIFLLLDWLLAAVRSSLGHVRLPQLMEMGELQPAAERTVRLLEQPHLRFSLRIAVVLVHFLLAGSAWLYFSDLLPLLAGPWLAALLLFLAGIIVLALEYAIEGLVYRSPEAWAMRLTTLGRLLDFVLGPLAAVMMVFLGKEASQEHTAAVTDDELKSWVQEENHEGGLEQGERQMIYSIFQFGETLCREIMVPRIDVVALEASASLPEAIEAVAHSGHSRIPVFADSIDNIVGILYAKDLLRFKASSLDGKPLRGLCRPAYFVPEAKKVDELLREMKVRRVHMAVVVDEYGGTAGIVTLEDIVEEIVGEIHDEYDQADETLYQQLGPHEYILLGRIDLEDVNELLGTHLAKEFADTLAGYIYSQIGKVPSGGETLAVEDWTLTLEQVSGRRIRKVHASRTPPAEEVREEAPPETEP